jgi:hypothetical protein
MDEAMTLTEAAAGFFPHGPLTLSSLRRAASTGTLEIAKVAGKHLTTLVPSANWSSRHAGPQSQATDLWEAAGWLGMTVEQLEQNYGHHHPDFQDEAAEAFGGRR